MTDLKDVLKGVPPSIRARDDKGVMSIIPEYDGMKDLDPHSTINLSPNADIPKSQRTITSITDAGFTAAKTQLISSFVAQLDRISDSILAYRPKPKTKAAKRRIRRKKRLSMGKGN